MLHLVSNLLCSFKTFFFTTPLYHNCFFLSIYLACIYFLIVHSLPQPPKAQFWYHFEFAVCLFEHFLFTAYLDSSQSSMLFSHPDIIFFFTLTFINNVNKHVLMSILLDFCPYLAISSIYNFTWVYFF